jgi:hypothetical protein
VIRVIFTPTRTGWRTAALSITSNAGVHPQRVSLMGKGEPRRHHR